MRREGENTCENCFWFSGNKADPFGYCRNPRNAEVGHAGSDYNSSNLLKPAYVGANKVCDYHEIGEAPKIREAFKIKGRPIIGGSPGFAGYSPYRLKWEREE